MKAYIILPLLLMPLCQGCIFEYLGPCPEDDAMYVEYDWQADPTARPEGMSVLFYPSASGPFWRFETPRQGGSVDLDPGLWNAICYNNDTSVILFENQDDFDTAFVTTRTANLTDGLSVSFSSPQPPRRAGEEKQPVIAAPDPIWSASAADFRHTDRYDTLRFAPVPLVARYSVLVQGVTNTRSIARCGMAISGLAAGRHLRSRQPLPVEVIIPGPLRVSATETLSGAQFNFGRTADPSRSILYVYIILRDARSLVFQYDVTTQIDSAPDPLDVRIVVKGPDLPVIEDGGGGGMDVGVDDWETVDIELST